MLSRSAEGQAVTEHFVLTDTKARERGKDGFRVLISSRLIELDGKASTEKD